ncbi:DUF4192 domain-containing protein [Streptomyces sp. NPDC048410]|uniref:DUF4192 domain-containing protein n=1 Tax=Streptomyces sp. NPDC048410 TaxID=3365545 RepID=UPI00371E4972
MTNHSETTGPFENGDITAGVPFSGPITPDTPIALRTSAELADALPYLLGYRPEDSMVLVSLLDRGNFGGRARLGIPAGDEDWPAAARQIARGLVLGARRRGTRPERIVAYVCQEPRPGESGRDVMLRLAPLAQLLRTECGGLDVPVIEALCVSDNRFWSYVCPVESCCPPEGTPMGMPGTSAMAAAATYAGIQVRGSLRELRARMQPWETSAALEQEVALDAAGMALVPRILDEASRTEVAGETLDLAGRIIRRFAEAAPVSGIHPADVRDDALLGHDEAAALILGLQDRTTRDRAAAWMEGDEAAPALRLWRALARRCVGPYREHAAAPLTLAGWVAWSTGDELEAREALAMALGADPEYLFAQLLHRACDEGLDPESIRRCLRQERRGRPLEEGLPSKRPKIPEQKSGSPLSPGTLLGALEAPEADPAAPTRRKRRPRSTGPSGTGPTGTGPSGTGPCADRPQARSRRPTRSRPSTGDRACRSEEHG